MNCSSWNKTITKHWFVNAAFAVHKDMKNLIEAVMAMG